MLKKIDKIAVLGTSAVREATPDEPLNNPVRKFSNSAKDDFARDDEPTSITNVKQISSGVHLYDVSILKGNLRASI